MASPSTASSSSTKESDRGRFGLVLFGQTEGRRGTKCVEKAFQKAAAGRVGACFPVGVASAGPSFSHAPPCVSLSRSVVLPPATAQTLREQDVAEERALRYLAAQLERLGPRLPVRRSHSRSDARV